MTIYAIAPRAIPDGVDYLTPGQRYSVFNEDDSSFDIKCDDDDTLFCLKKGCAHIQGDWTIVDGDADEATP